MQGLKSDFALAGIDVNLGSAPFDTIISQSAPCKSCSWEMSNWGGGWLFGVNPYPTGDQIFGTGSGSNFSNYSSATADKLIDATVHGTASLSAYEDYLAQQVPVLWLPQSPFANFGNQHQIARGRPAKPDPEPYPGELVPIQVGLPSP